MTNANQAAEQQGLKQKRATQKSHKDQSLCGFFVR
jgi:hypothetical protein